MRESHPPGNHTSHAQPEPCRLHCPVRNSLKLISNQPQASCREEYPGIQGPHALEPQEQGELCRPGGSPRGGFGLGDTGEGLQGSPVLNCAEEPLPWGWAPCWWAAAPRPKGLHGTWSRGGRQVLLSPVTAPGKASVLRDQHHSGSKCPSIPRPVGTALRLDEGPCGRVASGHVQAGPSLPLSLPSSHFSQPLPSCSLRAGGLAG